MPEHKVHIGTIEPDNDKFTYYTTSDIGIAFDAGDIDGAYAVISELVSVKTANYIADGKDPEEAEKERIEDIIFGTGLYDRSYDVRSSLRGRRLCVRFTDGGLLYGLPEGCYAVFNAVRALDGKVFFGDCIITGDVILYELDTALELILSGVVE